MLIGQKQVGKSFIAEKLRNYINDDSQGVPIYFAQRFALANPIKQVIKKLFMANDAQLYGSEEQKNTKVPLAGMTARRAMQLFGTECMQPHFGKDIWCRLLKEKIEQEFGSINNGTSIAIVDDCRFDHEVQYACENWNAFFIEILSPHATLNNDNHASEAGISLDCREVYLQAWNEKCKYYPLQNYKNFPFEFPPQLVRLLTEWQSS